MEREKETGRARGTEREREGDGNSEVKGKPRAQVCVYCRCVSDTGACLSVHTSVRSSPFSCSLVALQSWLDTHTWAHKPHAHKQIAYPHTRTHDAHTHAHTHPRKAHLNVSVQRVLWMCYPHCYDPRLLSAILFPFSEYRRCA